MWQHVVLCVLSLHGERLTVRVVAYATTRSQTLSM